MKNPGLSSDQFAFQLEKQMMNSFSKSHEVSGANNDISTIRKSEETLSSSKSTEQTLLTKIQKLESLLNLYSDLYRQSGKAGKIDRFARISSKAFFDNYYFPNKPVILTSMMKNWPALEKWGPDYFLTEYGHVAIDITKGRENDHNYEKNFRNTVVTIPFREFIGLIKKSPSTNDIYLVARNYFFSNPQFQSLRNDVIPPAQIIDTSYSGLQGMKLWFGPCGTVTPLHHDKHSILFCQVYGQKHFKMIPSFELPKIYNKDRYYSDLDPENIDFEKHPLFRNASVADVIINPGEMLFIPAGWWHWVRSLEISISVTFSNFRVDGNNTTWNCA